MSKWKSEIIDAISMYEGLRSDALEKGNWEFADSCLKNVTRLQMMYRYAELNPIPSEDKVGDRSK